jgi:hypothetical protein
MSDKEIEARWINVRTARPEKDCRVVVCNQRGHMAEQFSFYQKKEDSFFLYQPYEPYDRLCLDITHWMHLPKVTSPWDIVTEQKSLPI